MVTATGKPGALHVPRKGNKAFGQGPARIIIDKNQLLDEELEGTVRTTPESDNSSNGSNTSSLNSQEEEDDNNVQELKGGGGKNKKGTTVTSHKLGSLVNRFNGSSPAAAMASSSSSSKKAPVKTFKQQQEEAAAAAAAAAALAIPRSSLKGSTSNVVMCTATVQKKPELQGILRDYYYNENNVLVHKDPPKIKTPLEQRVKPSKRSNKGGSVPIANPVMPAMMKMGITTTWVANPMRVVLMVTMADPSVRPVRVPSLPPIAAVAASHPPPPRPPNSPSRAWCTGIHSRENPPLRRRLQIRAVIPMGMM
jgi:hypothetical protein